MKKQVAKIATSILIVLSLSASQLILPSTVQADPPNNFTTPVNNPTLNYDNPNQQSGNNPYKISLSSLAPLLTQVVGCTGIVNKAAASISGFLTDTFNGLFPDPKVIAAAAAAKAAKAKADAAAAKAAAASVSTNDTGVQSNQEAAKQQAIADAGKSQQQIKLQIFSNDCLNGIAIQLAKNQLTAMTKSAMNWVNTGLNGNPYYVQDVGSFMNSIEDQILQKETNLFKNPNTSTDNPYGRDFAIGAITAQQSARNFAGSMKQTLTNYLTPGSTPQSFANDFSQGGWMGWIAMTLDDNNNPLGFTARNAQNIADLQSKAVQQTTDQVNRNQGYLDQQKCILWQPVDADNQPEYNDDGSEMTTTNGKSTDICLRRATVTPGSTIKDKVSTYINSPERQLELAKTLNDALNALFSALLSKFENQGLGSLSSEVNTYTNASDFGSVGVNAVFDAAGNQLTTSSNSGGNTGGSVSSGDGFFDLTRDLGNTYVDGTTTIQKRGILQLQQDYIDGSKKVMDLLPNVLSSVGQLDYCIPGPNPNWQADAQTSIDSYISATSSGTTTATIDPSTIDTLMTDYGSQVDATYGTNSPMQDPSNSSYLAMSQEGLNITKDLSADADAVASADSTYNDSIATTKSNITKLLDIKDKVNKIIEAAQARRAAARKSAGLPAMKAQCVANEKVSYIVDGQRI